MHPRHMAALLQSNVPQNRRMGRDHAEQLADACLFVKSTYTIYSSASAPLIALGTISIIGWLEGCCSIVTVAQTPCVDPSPSRLFLIAHVVSCARMTI